MSCLFSANLMPSWNNLLHDLIGIIRVIIIQQKKNRPIAKTVAARNLYKKIIFTCYSPQKTAERKNHDDHYPNKLFPLAKKLLTYDTVLRAKPENKQIFRAFQTLFS